MTRANEISEELLPYVGKERRNSSKRAVKDKPSAATNAKYMEENENRMQKFVPTAQQKVLINKVREHTLTFVDSVAATGKTSSVLWYFCQEYIKDPSRQIVVVRTPVEAGPDKIGFLPNDLSAKLEPHFASTRRILEDFLGKTRVAADIGKRIHFMIPNYVLGSTIDNSLILIDEVQQLNPLILKLLLERLGKNSKCVVAGCSDQLYTTDKNRSALKDAMQRFFTLKDGEHVPNYPDIASHKFEIEEVMRHEIVKNVIRAYVGAS